MCSMCVYVCVFVCRGLLYLCLPDCLSAEKKCSTLNWLFLLFVFVVKRKHGCQKDSKLIRLKQQQTLLWCRTLKWKGLIYLMKIFAKQFVCCTSLNEIFISNISSTSNMTFFWTAVGNKSMSVTHWKPLNCGAPLFLCLDEPKGKSLSYCCHTTLTHISSSEARDTWACAFLTPEEGPSARLIPLITF